MGIVVLGVSLAVALVLPVVSFLRASRAARETRQLTLEVAALRRELEALRGAGSGDAPEAPATSDAAWHATVQALNQGRIDAPPVTGPEPASESMPDTPEPAGPATTDPTARAGPAAPAAPASGDAGTAGTWPPPLPATPASQPIDAAAALEQRIGARWLLYAGMAALILGLSYFVKFAFDNGWVSEPLRVAVGLAAGVALIVAGLRFSRRGLALFGHVLAGGGIVALYVALYAALHMYALIGPGTAFVAMVLVTGLSAALADREHSQALAMLALAGGFATPALIGGEGSQLVLFTYVVLLVAGAALLAFKHAWPLLSLVAYALTVLTVLVWAVTSYTPAAWLRTELFLTLYVVIFMAVLLGLRRRAGADLASRAVAAVLLSAPLLYHVASISVLAPQPGALLVYFVLSTVAALSVSHHTHLPWLRSVVLLLVALPLMAWMTGLRRPGWYAGAIITTCAVYLLHLAGQWRDVSDDEEPAEVPIAEVVHTHLNGLFLPAALYLFLETRAAWWNAPMLTGLALWNAGLAFFTLGWMRVLAWQFGAVAATLTAVAIGAWFDGPAVAVGWAMEAAALGRFALVHRNAWLGAGSGALFVIAALRLIDVLGEPLAVSSWPVVNTRALAAAVVIGAAAWMARLLRQAGRADAPARTLLILGGHVLAVAWLSAEIHAIFGARAYAASSGGRPSGAARAELFEQVALSVSWALYAVGLIAAGMLRRYAPVRYLGIALFGLTIVKVLLRDIAELDRVYQMLSVLGVGALLLLASYLYQRMAPAAPSAPSPDRAWDPAATDGPPPPDGAAEPLD